MSAFTLTEKQQYAMDRIAQGANIFLTGPGGVGKSVLVREIEEKYEESTIFLAPTGVAALNISGSTFHSVFRFPLGFLDQRRATHVDQKVIDLFRNDTVKRIVVDEISMVRADLFNAFNENLKRAKRSRKPFGGLQIIVVGDFFQLPPVLNNQSSEYDFFTKEFDSVYAFATNAWVSGGFELIELDKILRTDDEDFIMLLQSIRKRDENHMAAVGVINNICYNKYDAPDEDAIVLCTTNKDADSINQANYDELPGEEREFFAQFPANMKVEPAPKTLALKEGARIMILANIAGGVAFNGQLGYVVGFEEDKIMVLLDGHQYPTRIEKYTWEDRDYKLSADGSTLETVVTGKFIQYPMKLAYAITIHKSQGVSLQSAHINMGRGAFAHGQAYVALSRLRSMYKLNLMHKLNPSDIIVDQEVIQFYEDIKTANLLSY